MKCNSKRAKAESEWRKINELALINLKIMLITLHNEFGFGKDRIARLMQCLTQSVEKYNIANDDGALDYALNRDIKGLMLDDDLDEFLTAAAVGNRAQYGDRTRKTAVSISEAEEIRTKMLAFQGLQKRGDA